MDNSDYFKCGSKANGNKNPLPLSLSNGECRTFGYSWFDRLLSNSYSIVFK
jgi:hypothetical protein